MSDAIPAYGLSKRMVAMTRAPDLGQVRAWSLVYPFLPVFLAVAKKDYQANINQADFVAESETVRSETNQWVAKKTRDKIQNILPPGSLDHLTRLVLVNAIYFKGIWAKPYNKSQTSIQPFHISIAATTIPNHTRSLGATSVLNRK